MNKACLKMMSKVLVFVLIITSVFYGIEPFNTIITASAQSGETLTIDYSFVDISGGGYGAGHSGEVKRFQTFTAPKNGNLDAVSLTLNSRIDLVNGPALQDLVVEVYNVENGVPSGNALYSVTMPKAQVNINNGQPTRIDLSAGEVQLTEGRKYAISITQLSTEHDGVTGEHYRWPTSGNVPSATTETFGKYTHEGGWVVEPLGAGWLEVEISGEKAVDYSFIVDPPGSLFGVNGWVETRFQTFVPEKSGNLESVELLLYKRAVPSDTNPFPDVIVGIYSTDYGGRPVGVALGTSSVPADSIVSGQPFTVPISVQGLEAGVRYAVVLGVSTNGERYSSNLYTWPRKNLTYGEYAGVYLGGAYSAYTNLVHWAKINILTEEQPQQYMDYIIDNSFTLSDGYMFGYQGGFESRFQTFTTPYDGNVKGISFVLFKVAATASEPLPYSDIKVAIYSVNSEKIPTGPALAETIVKADEIADGGPTDVNIRLDNIESGLTYAAVITPVDTAPDSTHNLYKWAYESRDIGEKAGRLYGDMTIGNSGTNYHLWMKVTMERLLNSPGDERRPRSITLEPSGSVCLPIGEKLTPLVTVLDQNGEVMPDVSLTWWSENPEVATVNDSGEITAVTEGKVRIFAQAGHITGTLYVEAYRSEPKKIAGRPNLSVKLGESANLDLSIMDQYKNILQGLIDQIFYESSDSSVATVSNSGVVYGVASGNAIITARYGKLVKKISVNVYEDSESLVEPTPGMEITTDVKFKPGIYNFGSSGGIKIMASGITVDGNGATIIGSNDRINTPYSGDKEFYLGKPKSEDNITMKTAQKIDLGGKTNIKLSYAIQYDIEQDWDAAFVQVSEDGINFTSLATANTVDKLGDGAYPDIVSNMPGYTGKSDGWLLEEIDLSAYAGKQIYLVFRHMTDWAVEETGVFIDEIRITADGQEIFYDGAEEGSNKWIMESAASITDGKLQNSEFSGIGVYAVGVDNVTIKNLNARGFNIGIHVENAENWTIEYCDFSDNFTDPSYGWGDGNPYGAVRLTRVNNSTICYNNGNRVWNGLNLEYSNSNVAHDNDFSITSNVSLKMWNSSYNRIYDNNFSWGIRIDPGEVHARDSTSSLIESGSNYNYIARNDFSHGGDGIFIRVLNGWCSIGNYFEGNDTSWANNNAIESWSPGNVYIGNIANYSSYGFWLGGSDFTYLIGNEAKYNGGYGGKGKQNAPEAFGNAGVSVVNGASSHFYMSGNDIQYNNGPGVAIRYNADYPAYHWVIQNNTIKNNQNDPRGYKGYGIYLKNARWINILSNDIADNGDIPVKLDGNTSDIFVNNTPAGNIEAPRVKATITPSINIGQQEIEYPKIPAEIKNSPYGMVKMQFVAVKANTEVTFDASKSIDPNGLTLNFRWDFGDGTVEAGEIVNHVFTEPGFYRVGVTAQNGKLADIAGFIVNVVDEGQEIGTDNPDDWELVSDTATLTFDTGKRIEGAGAIRVNAVSGQDHKLVYPKNKNIQIDFSKYDTLSFFIDYSAEYASNGGYKRPIVRLKADENNYYEFTPVNACLERLHAQISEHRYGFERLSINYTGKDRNWVKSIVGTPTLEGIKYIEIVEGPSSSGISQFVIDGMKIFKVTETIDLSVNIAKNPNRTGKPEPIYSNVATGSDVWAPLMDGNLSNPSLLGKWVSDNAESNSWYGIDFGSERFVNKVEVYYYHNPTGNPLLDTIVKPVSIAVQYWDGSSWKNVKNPSNLGKTPSAGLNVISFETVLTSKVRVVSTAAKENSVAIYAFRAKNTANYASNCMGEALPARSVASSTAAAPYLKQIGVLINYRNNSSGPDLSDLVVELYETEGKNVIGQPLKSVVVPKEKVVFGQELKVDFDYPGLIPGKRYAIALTQSVIAPDGLVGDHYLWPTARVGFDEYYGKINNDNSIFEDLGTGWLKIYTDKSVFDISHSNNGGGFGVGHRDEQKRYQTFTVPADQAWGTIDGSIAPMNGWNSLQAQGKDHWVEVNLGQERTFNTIALYLENSDSVKLPAGLKVEYYKDGKWNEIKSLSGSSISEFIILRFTGISSSKVRVNLTNAEGSASGIRELEVISMPSGQQGGDNNVPEYDDTIDNGGSAEKVIKDDNAGTVTTIKTDGTVITEVNNIEKLLDNSVVQSQHMGRNIKNAVVEVKIENISGVKTINVAIPADFVSKAKSQNIYGIEFKSDLGEGLIPVDLLASANGGNLKTVIFSVSHVDKEQFDTNLKEVVGNGIVTELKLTAIDNNNKTTDLTKFEEPVSVRMPYTLKPGEDGDIITVFRIDDKGAVFNMKANYRNDSLVFDTESMGYYLIKENKVVFNDVSSDKWYSRYVSSMASKGIINGVGNGLYQPDRKITRAEFAKLIACMIDLKTVYTKEFADIKPASWYYEAVSACADAGIVNGIGNGKFDPNGYITRQDMAVMIARTLRYINGYEISVQDAAELKFADKDEISDYAKNAIGACVKFGILNGTDTNCFVPKNNATRAEVAKVIYSLFKMKQY